MDAREQADSKANANGRARRAGATRLTLPRSRRLQHDLEYEAVYEAKMRKSDGPLTVFVMPNGRVHWRLGLSIGKRVGGAVVRTRVKRMIREAFRLHQTELPFLADGTGCDMVVSSRAHDPAELDVYAAALLSAAGAAHAAWARRLQRKDGGKDSANSGGAS